RSTRAAVDLHDNLMAHERVLWVEQQHVRYHERREIKDDTMVSPDETGDDYRLRFNDPLYPKQWYLYNNGQNGGTSGMDMNVMPVWKLGYTGKGIHVSIVDDGVDGTHPDLKQNFDIEASYDFNNSTRNVHDKDPHPDDSIEKGAENAHGTRCAGEVAATANNSICGVGIAYEAGIGGMRILDGTVTDSLEAEALLYNHHYIDIYSCCWGPPDKGKDFAKPHTLTEAAIIKGVAEGRNGKGSIFVWASGNGGSADDDCNADGYVSRPETISIGAVNDEGLNVYFAEACSSTMAVTLSGGPSSSPFSTANERAAYGLNLVATTDLHGECTTSFVGTSSAAPLASGLFALILQANPNLTWRDLQHIISQGCFIPSPMEDGWHINGAGFHLNHMVGFGVLDAGKMVELALKWEPVGKRRKCIVKNQEIELAVEQGHSRRQSMEITGCKHITKLEHTIAHISFESPRRGDVAITLHSPFGTPSELLSTRKYDDSKDGIQNWPFMSVHNWGEAPQGKWTLEISYHPTPPDTGERPTVLPRGKNIAAVTMWGFTFYGTGEYGDESGSSEEVEEGSRVFEDKAGKDDMDTILHIYNSEQRSDEEIHVDLDDVAAGANLPPNLQNNMKGTEINTNHFDKNAPIETRDLLVGFLEYKREEGELMEFLRGLEMDTLERLYEEVEAELAEEEERAAYEDKMDTDWDGRKTSQDSQKRGMALEEKKKSSEKGKDLVRRRKVSRQKAAVLRELLREVESRK
ncbi:hypothetical protein BSL78_10176, partial [Apostichopus japonicus]